MNITHAFCNFIISADPPNSPMNLKQAIQESSGDIVLLWNSLTSDLVDYYIITVSPLTDSESTFTTPNTSIQLPVLYNQEYNVSVVASNCAGNSTPAEITILNISKCMMYTWLMLILQ